MPEIFYKVCPSSTIQDCILTNDEGRNKQGMTVPESKQVGANYRIVEINHNPSVCSLTSCTYLISFKNPNGGMKVISSRISLKNLDPGDIDLNSLYKNEIPHGEYVTYEINHVKNA